MEALRARAQVVFSGFWAVPLVTSIALAGLAFALVSVDNHAGAEGVSFGFHGDASAARSILSVVAGSLITVAGLTFSLLIVTLQLVSGQFTPRAMRRILADRVTQLVAGVFVGVVAYALIVLRSVRAEGNPDPLVPSLATTVSIWLTLGALGLLIFFVHHIGVSIQVSTIAARVATETLRAVDRLYPDDVRTAPDGALDRDALVAAWRAERPAHVARPNRAGYVRAVAARDLARELPPGARAAISVRAGDFVTEATDAIEMWPLDAVEDASIDAGDVIVLADERDVRSDVAFGLRQLVDISLRAISPGINDPTSAVTGVGYVTAILERLAVRAYDAGVLQQDDTLVVLSTVSFAEHLETGFAELARYAARDTRVACTMLDALGHIGRSAARAGADDRATATAEMAERVAGPALEAATTRRDNEELERRLTAARRAG